MNEGKSGKKMREIWKGGIYKEENHGTNGRTNEWANDGRINKQYKS